MGLNVVIDLVVILILAFCIWNGYRKGLIMTVLGIVIMIISISGARTIAGVYADRMAESVAPILSWVTDDAVDNALAGEVLHPNATPAETEVWLADRAQTAFESLGVRGTEIEPLIERMLGWVRETEGSLRSGVSHVFLRLISYVLLFIVAYIVLTALLMLLAQLVSSFFQIPPLRLIDTIGGLVAGLLFGGVLLFIVGWALRYAGLLIPPEILERTVFASFFMSSNPFSNMLAPIF
jgi:uncharacterized membrane protein required for colicin V production